MNTEDNIAAPYGGLVFPAGSTDQERWELSQKSNVVLSVFVPSKDSILRDFFPNGTAIIGSNTNGKASTVHIDYEFSADQDYFSSLLKATTRHVCFFQTEARLEVATKNLVYVGKISCAEMSVYVHDQFYIEDWCNFNLKQERDALVNPALKILLPT